MSHTPDDQEMASALKISIDQYHKLIFNFTPRFQVSIDEANLDDSSHPRPDAEIERKELREKIFEELSLLNEHEQVLLSLYYFSGLSLKEISEIMGVGETRLSQIHSSSLQTLQKSLRELRC